MSLPNQSQLLRLGILWCIVFTFQGRIAWAVDSTGVPFYLQFPRTVHPVYQYLDRLETSGDMPLISGTQPYLGHIHHPVTVAVRATANREFVRYQRESAANMQLMGRIPHVPLVSSWTAIKRKLPLGLSTASWLYSDGAHLASWYFDSTFTASIQPVYGLDVIDLDRDNRTIKQFAGGLRFEGSYGQRFHYLLDFRDYTESGNGPYVSRSQLYSDQWAFVGMNGKNSISYNTSESFLQYAGDDLSLAAGRGRFQWGPGHFGSLFLNSKMPPFDYVRFDAVLESKHSSAAVYYTFLHGWLESNIIAESLYVNPGGRARTLDAPKYFSAQRLELRPRANVMIGLSQGVVYGDRGVQLGYLTPVSFLYSIQHANNDKDNMVLGFDGVWRPVAGVKLYAEAFFDDISVSKLTTNDGGNKNAVTVGAHVVPRQTLLRHFDARVEYTRIRPFVYSHIFSTNVYTHWTSSMGYSLQPNSEFLTAEVRGHFYPLELGLRVTRQNHGENTAGRNVGGDIYSPLYGDTTGTDFPFLAGHLVRTTRVTGSIVWEALPNFDLLFQGSLVKETDQKRRIELQAGFGWNL